MVRPIIVIPSLEPDQKLLTLLDNIRAENQEIAILIIDDGSGPDYLPIFERAKNSYDCHVIYEQMNLGKGKALKIAMSTILAAYPDKDVMITIDSDGQHTYTDMMKTMALAADHPDALILGARQFDKDVPFRSKFGNAVTRSIMRVTTGINVSDTQTGLRIIPRNFLPILIEVAGDRFEYETNMLIEARKQGWSVLSQPIETIYIEGNASSHFRVVADSLAIYAVVFKYILSSVASFLIDVVVYTIIIHLLSQLDLSSIMIASFASRAVSSLFNYYMNRKFVFAQNTANSLMKYYLLVVTQITLSAILVYLVHQLLHAQEVVAVKIIVDSFLFVLSYYVQKNFIFKER